MRLNVHSLVPIAALVASVLAVVGLEPPRPAATSQFPQEQRRHSLQVDTNQLPIADFAEQDVSPNAKSLVRAKKNKRYNGRGLKDSPSTLLSIGNSHWLLKMPAIPVSTTDVVLVGTVLEAKAFLSEDKRGVYSEFTVHVEELLKNNGRITTAINDLVLLEREGGRIRFPSGRVHALILQYQGIPLVQHRYVFFVRRSDNEPNNLILTAYEIIEGKIRPMDGRPLGNGNLLQQFSSFDGVDSEQFLSPVRRTITAEATQSSSRQD